MKRFHIRDLGPDYISLNANGEWIRYSDHVEAMKRIAGDGGQQAEPVDGCTEENCRRCRTPEALRTPDMYHAGLSAAAELADDVCANSRNHLFRSGAKVVAGAIRSAAPAPSACQTCNDHGMIGGPSYYEPDNGGEPCPDCAPSASPAALMDAQIDAMFDEFIDYGNIDKRDARAFARALLSASPAGQAPGGYRLQPISEFDAYRDVLRDAERYQWMKGRYLAADFDWQGESVLVFKFPRNAAVSAGCDDTIDRGMSATPPAAE